MICSRSASAWSVAVLFLTQSAATKACLDDVVDENSCLLQKVVEMSILQFPVTKLQALEQKLGASVAPSDAPLLQVHGAVGDVGAGTVLIALLVFAVAALCLGLMLRTAKQHHSPAVEVARTVGIYCKCTDFMAYAIVIPQSYAIVSGLGGSAVMSGMMVSVFRLGAALGGSLYFAAAKRYPTMWRCQPRCIMVSCALVNIAALILYTSVAAIAGKQEGQGASGNVFIYALLVSRVASGTAAGVRSQLQRVHTARLTPHDEKPSQQSRSVTSGVVGHGAGPLLAVAVSMLNVFLGGHLGRYEVVGMAGVAIAASQLMAALSIHSLSDVTDELSAEHVATVFGEGEQQRRRLVISVCFAFAMCRGIVTSGLEVATPLILETQMGWSHMFCGVSGLSYLMIIPLNSMISKDPKIPRPSTAGAIRSLLVLALFGAMFRFQVPEYLLSDSRALGFMAGSLLFGDALVACGMYLSDGLSQGILMQHLMPESLSVFNVGTMNFVRMLLMEVPRFFGAPLARYLVWHGGQNIYAFHQMFSVMVALALVVFGLAPVSDLRQGNHLK